MHLIKVNFVKKSSLWLVALFFLLNVVLTDLALLRQAQASNPRIKDIVSFEGIRENMLVGYGLVVGLNGTGDQLNNSAFTKKSLEAFLQRLGVSTQNENLRVKNVAAVTVTAKLPAFARAGSKMDVSISTIGDAKSLEGGTLIATPLLGADDNVYAVAQGAISIGGFSVDGEESSVSKGTPTGGFIVDGAIVEREVDFDLNSLDEVKIALKNPDLSTAQEIEGVINERLGDSYAKVTDPGTVNLMIPLEYARSVASLLASIEQLEVNTDQKAKIIIDESTGTIAINDNVKIDTIAVAQGNLVVTIDKSKLASQPNSFSGDGAETVVLEQENVSVDEVKGNIAYLDGNTNLRDLVNALNLLGVSTRDLITILQTIKQAGALHASIETR